MDGIVFKLFGALFRFIGFLLVTGTVATALMDVQRLAFHSKHVGLVSMRSINQQLVGKSH
jgi:hypothetical protein